MSQYEGYGEDKLREEVLARDAAMVRLWNVNLRLERQRAAGHDSDEEHYGQIDPAHNLVRGLRNRAENLQGVMEYGFERTSTAIAKLKKERDEFEQENIQLRKQLAAVNGSSNQDGFATTMNQELHSGSTQNTTINNGPVYMLSPFNVNAPPFDVSTPSSGPLPYRPGPNRISSIPASATIEDLTADGPTGMMDIDTKKHPDIKPPRYRTDCFHEKKAGHCRGVCKYVHNNQRDVYSKLIPTLPRNKWDENKAKRRN